MANLARIPPNKQLAPIPFVAPGFRGLNTVQSGSLMDPSYCTQAQNAIIDTSGRLAARQGVTALTLTPITLAITFTGSLLAAATSATLTGNWTLVSGSYQITFSDSEVRIGTFTQGATSVTWATGLTGGVTANATITQSVQSIFEYNQGGGVYQDIVAWPGGISNVLTNPNANQIQGSVNVNNGRWWFQNFNNKCIGFQRGQKPIVYTGTGTFATVVESAGTAPQGGVGCAAFGRLWVVDTDLQTIKYSGLLDETDWSTTDGNAGLIDMRTIWSDGTDQVTAIFPFNASLVVCGTKHVILFTDGRGSMLGIDPTQAYVFDVLLGTGCIGQWTVDHIGEADVVFLSPNGLQSLQRLTQNRNNPLATLSKYNRDTLVGQINTEASNTDITGVFNAITGFYILGMPTNNTTWCFDMRRLYKDDVQDTCSITTIWTMAITAAFNSAESSSGIYIARQYMGTVGNYSGYSDEGASYTFAYTSPWMSLGEQVAANLKMLKRLAIILYTAGNVTFSASWNVDFNSSVGSASQTVSAFGALSQYGVGQYGIAQYGGGSNLYQWKYAAHIRGQFYQLGISALVTGVFALQQAQLAAKIGRVA